MLKIVLGLCYYEDLQGIKRLYDSLYKVDAKLQLIIAVDGKYKSFDDSNTILSSREIHDYLISNVRYLTVNFTAWEDNPTELQKRNKYLELCDDDIDFLIVIDTDEYFAGDWKTFVSNLEQLKARIEKGNIHEQMRNLHFIRCEDCYYPITSSSRYANRPRIFYQPSKIRYYGCHYTWIHKENKQALIYTEESAVAGITIMHDSSYRPTTYEENMSKYQTVQRTIEDNSLIQKSIEWNFDR